MEIYLDNSDEIKLLKAQLNRAMQLLADIETKIDKSKILYAYEQPDFQQITSAIKYLRNIINSPKVFDENMSTRLGDYSVIDGIQYKQWSCEDQEENARRNKNSVHTYINGDIKEYLP